MKKQQKKVDKVVKNSSSIKKTSISIRPIGDRVLVQEIQKEDKEKIVSGIILPNSSKEEGHNSKRGKIIAVGDGKIEKGEVIPLTVKIGEEILFQWGDEIKIEGQNYFIVSESNILGIIN